jgi:hypothetical protein
MNFNWLGLTAAFLALIVYWASYRFLKNKPIKLRLGLSVLAFVASLPGLSFAFYYTHLLPESAWNYHFRSLSGTEFFIIFIGLFGGLVATFLFRPLQIIAFLAVVIFSTVPFIKPLIGPISPDAFRDRWDHSVCRQSTGSTCGAACLATILKHHGKSVTEAEIAARVYSYAGGTEAWYLARVARQYELKTNFEISSSFAPDKGLPAIVGVRIGSVGHFIAILGYEGDQLIIGDPLHGRELKSLEQLQQQYEFTGFHLRVLPQH